MYLYKIRWFVFWRAINKKSGVSLACADRVELYACLYVIKYVTIIKSIQVLIGVEIIKVLLTARFITLIVAFRKQLCMMYGVICMN